MKLSVRRFAVIMAVGATSAATVLFACAFPSPLLSDVDPDPDAGSARTEEDVATVEVVDASNYDDVPYVDASETDVVVINPGGKMDAAACPTEDCDCDKDGYFDLKKVGCEDAGGKDDCDDLDSRAHPGQGYLEDPAEPPMNGDWNCNGIREKRFARTNITCALLTDCTEGLVGNPPCGTETDYLYCQAPLGLLCFPRARARETQACK